MHLLLESLSLVAPTPVQVYVALAGLKAIHLPHRGLIRLLSILRLA